MQIRYGSANRWTEKIGRSSQKRSPPYWFFSTTSTYFLENHILNAARPVAIRGVSNSHRNRFVTICYTLNGVVARSNNSTESDYSWGIELPCVCTAQPYDGIHANHRLRSEISLTTATFTREIDSTTKLVQALLDTGKSLQSALS